MTYLALFMVLLIQEEVVSAKKSEIHSLISDYYTYHQFTGNVLVAKKDEVIYQGAFGRANVALGHKNTLETSFQIASLTKQFTAVMVLKLASQNKLKLDDTVSDFLPYYRKDTGEQVTLHHLLNHTSGIPSYGEDQQFMREQAHAAVDVTEFVKTRCSEPLKFKPGTAFEYSNSGYYILGAIIEEVTGAPFCQSVAAELFKPIGFDNNCGVTETAAIGYRQYGSLLVPAKNVHTSVSFAAGGLRASIGDLYKWNRALHSGKILPRKFYKQMIDAGLGHYGYGVRVRQIRLADHGSKTMVSHGGALFGFNHEMVHVLEDDLTIVVLSNGGQKPEAAVQNIIRILYDMPYQRPQPDILDAVLSSLYNGDMQSALEQVENLSQDSRYVVDINSFYRRGMAAIHEGEYPVAQRVFQIANALFPKNGKLFEGLGKAYLGAGEIDKATANFKQAYALDAACDDAKRFLDLLGVTVEPNGETAQALPRETLEKYVGEYRMTPRHKLKVYLEGDQLMAQPSKQRPVVLIAESRTQFKVERVSAKLEFHVDAAGQATAVTLTQKGVKRRGKRI